MAWIKTQAGQLLNTNQVVRLRESDVENGEPEAVLVADLPNGYLIPVAAYTDDLMVQLAADLGVAIEL